MCTDKDGNICEKRLAWAYLDDITLAHRPDTTHQDVLDYMSDPDVIDKFGLTVNPSKSWFISRADLDATGHKLLGSWIGGPDDDSSEARDLIVKKKTIYWNRAESSTHVTKTRHQTHPKTPLTPRLVLERSAQPSSREHS